MSFRMRMMLAGSLVAVVTLIGVWLTTGERDNFTPGDGAFVEPPGDPWGRPLELTSSEQCAECHRQVYDEWKSSHHAFSWLNPEPRRRELSDNFKNKDCIPCHAPRPMIEVGYGRRPLERELDRDDGINCFTCHRHKNVHAAANPLSSAASTAPCNPSVWEPITKMGLCAPCHDQHKVHKDWQQTIYASEGPDYKDCNDCHMPVVPGPGTLGGQRSTHRSHAFPGCHDADILKTAATLECALSLREGGRPLVTVLVTNTGTGHNLPADERHRAVDLEVRFVPDQGPAGDEVRLVRFRNPYRHEFDMVNPFKVSGRLVQNELAWDDRELVVTQVRIPPSFNPVRKVYYPESTQLLAGESRGLWFNPPTGVSGKLVFRLYYKLQPFLANDAPTCVVMAEHSLPVGPGAPNSGSPIATLRDYLNEPVLEEEVTATSTRGLWGHRVSRNAKASLVADESADLEERLDAMALAGPGAEQAMIDALLLVMKDRSQTAFVLQPEATEQGFQAMESPFGGIDSRAELRWSAIQGLERIGALQALPELLGALYDRHPVVRNHAARALWRLGSSEGLPVLLKALEERAFENETANRFLMEITGEDQGFDTDSGYTRKTAAIAKWRALLESGIQNPVAAPRMGDDAALDHRIRFLVAMLGQHQFLFMEQSRRALSAMGDLSIDHLEELVNNTEEENQQRRAYAVQVLRNIGSDRARQILVRLLKDRHAPVRARVADALGLLEHVKAGPVLRPLLEDPDESVVIASARALGQIGDAGSVPALGSLFSREGGSERARLTAACSLVRLGERGGGAGVMVHAAMSGPLHVRTDIAEFLESWHGGLEGFDPVMEPESQVAALARWKKLLVP